MIKLKYSQCLFKKDVNFRTSSDVDIYFTNLGNIFQFRVVGFYVFGFYVLFYKFLRAKASNF